MHRQCGDCDKPESGELASPSSGVGSKLAVDSRGYGLNIVQLIRGKRNFTRTAVHAAPRPFLFIALNAIDSARLTMHLSDQLFISHKHRFDDGLPNLEEVQETEMEGKLMALETPILVIF